MPRHDRFLRACRREAVDRTPIWLMRQAGRYMPEYRALREKHALLEMIRDPDLATEVTMQPVRAFDVDAAIIFADILPALEELGLDLSFVAGEGPVFANPIRSADDVARVSRHEGKGQLDATCEAIRRTRQCLDGTVPLIGFAGAPFTLACYAIEGGSSRDFLLAKTFMRTESAAWDRLLEAITAVLIDYLKAQIEAGAQAIQLFDSWAGTLSPQEFRRAALPYVQQIMAALRDAGVPRIYFGTGLGGSLAQLKDCGADVIGLDWRISLRLARAVLGSDLALQGNLDPTLLLAPADAVRREAEGLLEDMRGEPGYIFNLGHGVLKETPVDHVQQLVECVHAHGF